MSDDVMHLGMAQLQAGLPEIRKAPRDAGHVELIVSRPAVGVREVVNEATLDPASGLVGDSWRLRPDFHTRGPADPEVQVTLMNARSAALVAQRRDRWPLAGDQLYVDFDLSLENLPPGTRLTVGESVLEVSAKPHTGCSKFVARFGVDAMKFVNSDEGRALNLRGINARVVQAGTVKVGDQVKKVVG